MLRIFGGTSPTLKRNALLFLLCLLTLHGSVIHTEECILYSYLASDTDDAAHIIVLLYSEDFFKKYNFPCVPTLLRHTSGAYVGICRKSLTEVEVDTAAAGYLKISMLLLHHSWNVVHITKTLYMTGLEQAAGFHL